MLNWRNHGSCRRQFRPPFTIPTAFTLVELLVVIGIIGVLISILLPSLNKARQSANAVKCSSNLRQIALGWALYANGNKGISVPGRMPSAGTNIYYVGNGDVFRPRWFITLGAQSGIYAYSNPAQTNNAEDNTALVTNQVFVCPNEPERINNRNFTYGYNYQFLGNSRSHPTRVYVSFPQKISKFRAAETVLAADAMGTAAGHAKAARTGYNIAGSAGAAISNLGNHAWSLDPPRVIVGTSDLCDDSNRTNPLARSAPEERHMKKANVAFCDGHVAPMSLGELGYAVAADGSVMVSGTGANNVTAHNRMFDGKGADLDPPTIN